LEVELVFYLFKLVFGGSLLCNGLAGLAAALVTVLLVSLPLVYLVVCGFGGILRIDARQRCCLCISCPQPN
jgi:hypothetical protein